jgi:xanthine dehydrogenase accessory factor
MRTAELYEKIAELTRKGVPFVLATITATSGSSPRGVGAKMLVLRDGSVVDTIGGGVLEQKVVSDALDCLASGTPRSARYDLREEGEGGLGALCGGSATVFLEVYARQRTLLIVGAGHIGRQLCALGRLLEFRVIVLDPRNEMVTAELLPEADELVCGDPARAAELVAIDESTHVVIVTHAHEHDQTALASVLTSAAGYIGMMGSARKVQTIRARLAKEGVTAEQLERVHAPIGLDIGAETPAELALCILAEIVAEDAGVRLGDAPGARSKGALP